MISAAFRYLLPANVGIGSCVPPQPNTSQNTKSFDAYAIPIAGIWLVPASWSSPFDLKSIHWIDFLTVSPHQAHSLKGEEDSNRLSIDYPTNGTNPAPAKTNPSHKRRVLPFKGAE